MKLGMFCWYGFELPIADRLKHIRQAGFDTVMLWWDDSIPTTAALTGGVIDLAKSLGLGIENIHLPIDHPNDLWSEDRSVRDEIVAAHLDRLRACREAGLPMAVMHVTSGSDLAGPTPEGLESMERIAAEADRRGVTLAIENTRKPDCVAFLLDQIASPHFGLCYDTSHGRLYEPEPFYLMKKYPDRIKCFHISDNDNEADRHWIPGRGAIDWTAFTACFPKEYRHGSLSLEVFPERGDIDEKDHLAASLAALENLRDKIEESRRQ